MLNSHSNLKKGTRWLVSALAAFLFTTAHLAAAEDSARTITLAFSDGYAPYCDSEYPGGGMATQILEKAFSQLPEYELALDFYPSWEKAEKAVRDGNAEATYPYARNETREVEFDFSVPLAKSLVVWFARQDTELEGVDVEDLKGLTVAKPKGFFIHDIDRFLRGGLKLRTTESLKEAFELLASGEVDLVSADLYAGNATITKLDSIDAEDFCYLDHRSPGAALNTLHLMVGRASPGTRDWLTALNKEILKMKTEGSLKTLQTKALEPVGGIDSGEGFVRRKGL